MSKIRQLVKNCWKILKLCYLAALPNNKWWRRATVVFICLVFACVGTMYGIAQWYMRSQQSKPYLVGVSYIGEYATYLGLDPHKTLDELLGIGIKHFRLVSYWDSIEPEPGQYNYKGLDWQFNEIQKAGGTVTLAIGLRQPRWPECHVPAWVNTTQPENAWYPALKKFIQKTVNRYKNKQGLISYQLENEYFLHSFGKCQNYSRQRLTSEYNMVKRLDPNHPIVLNRSLSIFGIATSQPVPDKYGISIYRHTYNVIFDQYVRYPFPAWYYSFMAGLQQIVNGKPTIIHEFQDEPWPPGTQAILDTTFAEQNKTFTAKTFSQHQKFAHATGIRTVYFWGAPYWYYRKVTLHDPSVWNAAKQYFEQYNSNS